jgi:ATP-dependent DNA ligase
MRRAQPAHADRQIWRRRLAPIRPGVRINPAPARRPGLTLAVFDVLWLDGESLLQETYDSRRACLADLELPAHIACLPSWPGTLAPNLFRACEEHGVEGIVLNRRDSLYRPGQRCPHWRKVKSALWFERHAEHRHRH